MLDLASKYRHILEGLDCLDKKLWTDEKKIKEFTDVLETYCEKGVKLVEDSYRKHLERLKYQRDQREKAFKAECEKYDNEIRELEKKIGDRPYSNEVIAEVSLIS